MFWTKRLLAFVFSIFIGTFTWLLVAKLRSNRPQAVQAIAQLSPPKTVAMKASQPKQEDSSILSVKWSSPEALSGYANVKTITLRDTPDADASIISKFKVDDYESVEILGASDGFLHVRFPGRESPNSGATAREQTYEGWTLWGSVVPDLTAIVLEAETGKVVARLPLNPGVDSVTFSPDGARATFYGTGVDSACEVMTSDYKVSRCLSSPSLNTSFKPLFYGPSDGALYSAVITRGEGNENLTTSLNVMRLGDNEASKIPAEISSRAEDFAVSPDDSRGFVLHREDRDRQEMTVDVVDLATFKIRNSFTLHGTDLPTTSDTFVVNRDGTELFARLYTEGSAVSVIDTETGNIKRVLSFNALPRDYWYFDGSDLIGDSLLLRVWNQDHDEMHSLPHTFWLGSNGRVAAQKGIYWVAQGGDTRYAVNAQGTKLFKLDVNNRIRESLNIDRPEFRQGLTSEKDLGTFGLSASPDGKRLILFVGVEDGC
ncbi:MAG TPA: hypothetical protein VF779_18420 [Pyrinomonadaceae bacterium]